MSEILRSLRRLMPELTLSERKVARYILKDPNHIINLTIQELSILVSVSKATIVRFSKKVGTEGFSHLKLLIAQSYSAPSENVYDYLKRQTTPELKEALLQQTITSLTDTTSIQNQNLINNIAEKISTANQVIICGIGGSGACGEMARQRLLRLGINAQVCTESSIMPLLAQNMKTTDVGIGLSHRGNTGAVAEFLEICSRLSQSSIAITTNKQSPVSKASTFTIQYVSSDTTLGPEAGDARIAQIYVFDILCSTVARILDDRKKEVAD